MAVFFKGEGESRLGEKAGRAGVNLQQHWKGRRSRVRSPAPSGAGEQQQWKFPLESSFVSKFRQIKMTLKHAGKKGADLAEPPATPGRGALLGGGSVWG